MKNRRVFWADRSIAFIMIGPVASIVSSAPGDEPFIQADVYDALFQAYVQCDSDFDQSRSGFITEKLEHDSGQITIASLKKILSYKLEVANQEIALKAEERELYVSEILGAHSESEDFAGDRAEEDKNPHGEVREIDAFLKEQRRYVEVHECVFETLKETRARPWSKGRSRPGGEGHPGAGRVAAWRLEAAARSSRAIISATEPT